MSEGDSMVDFDQYGRLAGHLRRLFETLGVKRVAKPVNDHNVLSDYFSRPPPKPEGGGGRAMYCRPAL